MQIRNLKKRAAEQTGYIPKFAMYGENAPSYMTTNNFVMDYLARNDQRQDEFLASADIPTNMFGLTWIPGYISFYEDQNSQNQQILGADQVIFFPEISDEWWEILQGSYMVPTTINITTDAAAAIGSMRQVFGMFGYGQAAHNPPTVVTYYGDTFLPTIRNPDVVYQATVANY